MLNYTLEMKEQDALWRSESEDLEKMKELFKEIMNKAVSLGFKGKWIIYDGNKESIIDIYQDDKHEENCMLGIEEPLGSFGFCKPLIDFLNEIMQKRGDEHMKDIINELKESGYDYAVAIATEAEIKAGAACGQLSIIIEKEEA